MQCNRSLTSVHQTGLVHVCALHPLHYNWENQHPCKRREDEYPIAVSRLALEMLTNFLDRLAAALYCKCHKLQSNVSCHFKTRTRLTDSP